MKSILIGEHAYDRMRQRKVPFKGKKGPSDRLVPLTIVDNALPRSKTLLAVVRSHQPYQKTGASPGATAQGEA